MALLIGMQPWGRSLSQQQLLALRDVDGSGRQGWLRGDSSVSAGCGWLEGNMDGSGRVWVALGPCEDGVSKAELMLPEASDSTETEQGPRCRALSAPTWEQVTTQGICAAYSFGDVLILL